MEREQRQNIQGSPESLMETLDTDTTKKIINLLETFLENRTLHSCRKTDLVFIYFIYFTLYLLYLFLLQNGRTVLS